MNLRVPLARASWALVASFCAMAACDHHPSSPKYEWVKDIKIQYAPTLMTGPGVGRAWIDLSTATDPHPDYERADTTTFTISSKGPFSASMELHSHGWRALNIKASAPGTGSITVAAGDKSATIDITAVALSFKTVAMANGYACGLSLDDTAWCWGGNYGGELGTFTVGQCNGSACQYGGNDGNPSPLPVDGGHVFTDIATAGYVCTNGATGTCGKTCALAAGDELWCWGLEMGVDPKVVSTGGLKLTAL